jgi:ATP-dependent helicase/nuclease subunit B
LSLKFILGRAGAGKTRACLDEITAKSLADPKGAPLILLVPEQASLQYEMVLVSSSKRGGIMRAQVLSFRRLAWRVLQEVGGAARTPIGDMGKRMVLRRLLEQRRGELKVFQRTAGQRGFADTLAGAIAEMKLYRVNPEDLRKKRATLNAGGQNLLAGKLEDLALLYEDLDIFMKGRYSDPDDYLNLLSEKLAQSATVPGAEIWVDGFTGFTPQEYGVLESLLAAASLVNVALCLDGRATAAGAGEDDVFFPTLETYHKLVVLAEKAGVSIEESVIGDETSPRRFAAAPSLAHLERWFFRRPAAVFEGFCGEVELLAATSRRAEVEAVAREIIALSRSLEYRWRDITVLMRDLDTYYLLLTTVFDDYGIPYFIDKKRTVMHHPLVELVRSALEAVGGGWAYEPLFRFLKTDLAPITRDDADLLENYVLAYGLKGNAWTGDRDWVYYRRDSLEENSPDSSREAIALDRINRARVVASRELISLHRRINRPGVTVRDISAALFDMLEGLGVPARLEEWKTLAEESGKLEEAREHGQIWNSLVKLLDEMAAALGEERLSLAEYSAILDAGLESMRLGLIPPGMDQVLVGNLDRSRSPSVKAALVLGVGDGVLPARLAGEGIFTDGERERLAANGLELAPTTRRKVLDEQYLVYQALTRSSHKLYISYPLADEEGRGLTPSPVIARLKELLPGSGEKMLGVEPDGAGDNDLYFIARPGRSLTFLGGMLRNVLGGHPATPVWRDVYNWFAGREEYGGKLDAIISGLFHTNSERPLTPAASLALYGKRLRTSVSRLEKFRSCPFAHFLSYGIKLQERAVQKLSYPDMGQFFHAALKMYGDRLKQSSLDWGSVNKGQISRLVGEVVEILAPRLQNEILLSSARHRSLLNKLKRQVTRAAAVLAEHSRRGAFCPVALELAFGAGKGDLPPLMLELPGGGAPMEIYGRIDRLDAALSDKGYYVRIVDYKSGFKDFNLAGVYNGLDIQLLTYLVVALDNARHLLGSPALPGGMFYFRVADPILKTLSPPDPEQAEKLLLKELKMKGLALADPDVVKMMDPDIDGHSNLIAVALGKNGFYKNAPVLTEDQFSLLIEYLRRSLTATGMEINTGGLELSPYRQGNFSACTYCPFKPVCQFDPVLGDNQYRLLANEPAGQIWANIVAALKEQGY